MPAVEVLHDNKLGFNPGTVNNEQIVRSVSQEQIQHESELGTSFTWVSANADINAGDTILIVRNTSDSFLVMTELIAHPGNILCDYSINLGNATTAFTGGSAVTQVNLNRTTSNKTFDHDAHTDEESVADGTDSGHLWVSTVESNSLSLAGIILGKNDFIQINQETESTLGRVVLKGFFIGELQ